MGQRRSNQQLKHHRRKAKRMYLQQKAMATLLMEEGGSKIWKAFWLLIVIVGMSVMMLALVAVIVPINEAGILLDTGFSSSNKDSSVPTWFWGCIIVSIIPVIALVFMSVLYKQKKFSCLKLATGITILALLILGILICYCLRNLFDIIFSPPHPFIIVYRIIFLFLVVATLRLLYLCFKAFRCKDVPEKVARACAMDTITIVSIAGILLTIATVLVSNQTLSDCVCESCSSNEALADTYQDESYDCVCEPYSSNEALVDTYQDESYSG